MWYDYPIPLKFGIFIPKAIRYNTISLIKYIESTSIYSMLLFLGYIYMKFSFNFWIIRSCYTFANKGMSDCMIYSSLLCWKKNYVLKCISNILSDVYIRGFNSYSCLDLINSFGMIFNIFNNNYYNIMFRYIFFCKIHQLNLNLLFV